MCKKLKFSEKVLKNVEYKILREIENIKNEKRKTNE